MQIAEADTLLNSSTLSKMQLDAFLRKLVLTSESLYGTATDMTNFVGFVAYGSCGKCGGRGHDYSECPTKTISHGRRDDGTSTPSAEDRNWRKRDKTDGDKPKSRKKGDRPKDVKRGKFVWRDGMSNCKYCDKPHLHQDCPNDEGKADQAGLKTSFQPSELLPMITTTLIKLR
jgi:hypothetical protein